MHFLHDLHLLAQRFLEVVQVLSDSLGFPASRLGGYPRRLRRRSSLLGLPSIPLPPLSFGFSSIARALSIDPG